MNARPDEASSSRHVAPLLVRLAIVQPCAELPDVEVWYDDSAAQLRVRNDQDWSFAADVPVGGPKTKKFDIERGEDLKGRW